MTSRLLIGSANPGKIAEYRRLLAGLDLELVAPDDLDPAPPEPEERGDTFLENATSKARAYAEATGVATVADDSGLEVDALHGAPGVRSRRYFGDEASAAERNVRLLALLEGITERRARFACVVALATPVGGAAGASGPLVETFEGEVLGEIADSPRGEAGFGYDPIFVIAGDGRTMAELSAGEKDEISHRGRAVAQLRARLTTEPR